MALSVGAKFRKMSNVRKVVVRAHFLTPTPLSRDTREEYKIVCYGGLRFISPQPKVAMISVTQQGSMSFK
jgi:hypothetical protein